MRVQGSKGGSGVCLPDTSAALVRLKSRSQVTDGATVPRTREPVLKNMTAACAMRRTRLKKLHGKMRGPH